MAGPEVCHHGLEVGGARNWASWGGWGRKVGWVGLDVGGACNGASLGGRNRKWGGPGSGGGVEVGHHGMGWGQKGAEPGMGRQ